MQYRRAFVPGGTFFFTVVTANRRPLLANEKAVGVLREAFKAVIAKRPFAVVAMAVLPEHLHSVWTLPPGDSDFATRWRLIKTWFTKHHGDALGYAGAHPTYGEVGLDVLGYAGAHPTYIGSLSRARKGERDVWQRRYWEHQIRDADDLRHHVEYIHYNPVRHGHVSRPIEWPFSSFRRYVETGVYAEDWGGGGVVFPEDVGNE